MFELKESLHSQYADINLPDKLDSEIILTYVNNLNSDKQNILKMRFWQDLKFSEIDESMGKSEDAVKNVL